MSASKFICGKGQRAICCLVLMCFSVLAMMARPSSAQTAGAGSITGTVTDSSGAVVSGAMVTVKNVDTGIEHSYQTNQAGLYVAPFLQPGHYTVSATAPTFATVIARNLNLLVGQTLTIDLSMTVASSTTTVEVSGETPRPSFRISLSTGGTGATLFCLRRTSCRTGEADW
jgi:hypothetical protein